MKIALGLLLLSFVASAADSQFEEIVKSIDKPNENLINVFKKFNETFSDFKNNADGKKDLQLIQQLNNNSKCMNIFVQDMRDPKYRPLVMSLQSGMKSTQEEMMKVMKRNDEFTKKVEQDLTKKTEEELCGFKIIKDEAYLSKDEENKKIKDDYKKLMEAKTIAHPAYADMIKKIESNKESLEMGMSSELKLEPGNYEKNFVIFSNAQFKAMDGGAESELDRAFSDCKIKIDDIFKKHCKGKEKYEVIPYENIKKLACLNDDKNYMEKCFAPEKARLEKLYKK